MTNKREIEQEAIRLQNLKILIETYEEIAANQMRKNRSAVLANRVFNEGLVSIYQEIKQSYKTQLANLQILKRSMQKTHSASLMSRNGRTICLLLSANTGLFGDIIARITAQFIDFVKTRDVDIAIIGRIGRKIFDEYRIGKKYFYFDVPDLHPDQSIIEQLTSFLIRYEKIYIFYGKFESVGVQRPTILDVTGEESLSQKIDHTNKSPEQTTTPQVMPVKYLFEPSLEEVMIFFEQQIFASIIEQTVKESELAKFASRMITLDSATENVKSKIREVVYQRQVILHRQRNKRQQELLYGLSLWQK
jgi:F0F1-type ATP synthase gamma subunit